MEGENGFIFPKKILPTFTMKFSTLVSISRTLPVMNHGLSWPGGETEALNVTPKEKMVFFHLLLFASFFYLLLDIFKL